MVLQADADMFRSKAAIHKPLTKQRKPGTDLLIKGGIASPVYAAAKYKS
jgi:hypothetical protein